jgi:hypothetical protein
MEAPIMVSLKMERCMALEFILKRASSFKRDSKLFNNSNTSMKDCGLMISNKGMERNIKMMARSIKETLGMEKEMEWESSLCKMEMCMKETFRTISLVDWVSLY